MKTNKIAADVFRMFLFLLFGPEKKPFLVCEEEPVPESDGDKGKEDNREESSASEDSEDEDYL